MNLISLCRASLVAVGVVVWEMPFDVRDVLPLFRVGVDDRSVYWDAGIQARRGGQVVAGGCEVG